MREILFRGKELDGGDWVEGNLISNDSICYPALFVGMIEASRTRYGELSIDGHYLPQVISETVGQFTGMTDKDGKKIFEGDVIRAKIEGGNHEGFTWPNMQVDFQQGAFCLIDRSGHIFCVMGAFAPSVSLEVIGNIHDNPGLVREVVE